MSDLRVENLWKSFPYGEDRLQVLRGAGLHLPAGTFASITGESGCGKSTLLHILGGMETPDEGEVVLDGEAVFQLGPEARARFRNRRVGFVFQFHHLLPEFSSLENLMMPLLIRGLSKKQLREQAAALLPALGLDHRAQARPGELSGGEQQRLAIGRALITEPGLLLMDEPTGNLDHDTGERIMDLVLRLASGRGATVILVTHNQSLARLCPQQYRLDRGLLHLQ